MIAIKELTCLIFFQVADEVDLNKVLSDLGIDQLASFVPMEGSKEDAVPRGLFYFAKNSSTLVSS